jgi:hypothetical protein
MTTGSAKFLPHLTTVEVKAAHWPQLEAPEEVNDAIEKWLVAFPPSSAKGEEGRKKDEL